jgi:chromosome segregation ATPase
LKDYENRLKKHDDKVKLLEGNKRSLLNDLEGLEEELHKYDSEAKQKRIARRQSEEELQDVLEKISQLEQKIQEVNSQDDTIDPKDLLSEKNRLNSQINSLNGVTQGYSNTINKKERELKDVENKLIECGDTFQKRLNALSNNRRIGKDLMTMHHYVSNNKSRFSDKVFGPLACEISIKDPKCITFAEKQIGQLLNAFVVTNSRDYNLLNDYANGRATIVMADSRSHNQSRARIDLRLLSNNKLDLRWLDEALDADPIILDVLKHHCGLDQCVSYYLYILLVIVFRFTLLLKMNNFMEVS